MLVAGLGCTASALSDEITFADGEHLTGKLVSVHAGVVTFQSDRLGLLQLPIQDDMSLVVSGDVVIRTADGKQYEGLMREGTGSGWNVAVNDNTEVVTIPPSQVSSITAAQSSSAAAAQVIPTQSRENVWESAPTDRPGLIGPWSVDSRLAISGVNSTKSRRLLHWNGELDHTSGIGVLKLTAERVYSTSTNQVGKGFIDDDLTRGEANFTKDLSERSSIYADFEGLHDVVSYINKRVDLAGGAQYKVFARPKVRLTAFIGPAFIHYSYLPNVGVTPPAVDFGAVQFGYRSAFHLPAKIIVQHDFRFNQGYRGDGSYLSYVDLRAKRSITSWLYMDGKISDDFDSRAAYQANPNTVRYSAGIGVTFDAF